MKKRVKTLWQLLPREIDGMLITSPENVRYLSGFSGTEGTLLVTRKEGHFLTDGRYTTQAHDQVKNFTIRTFKEKWKEIGGLIKKRAIRSVGCEAGHMTVASIRDLEKEVGSSAVLQPVGTVFDQLRIIKDAYEIAALKRTARIAAQSLQEILFLIKPGVRERDIAAELEYRLRRNGGDGPAFDFIVASGDRSALPHGVASQKKLAQGDCVTIDYGAVCHGYISDETCTFILGSSTRRQKRIYETVREAHDRAIAAVKPGVSFKSIDAVARDFIARSGFKKYFNHGTGHGIGLAVHEPPRISSLAEGDVCEGMVFTVEPGIYVPGWGGVRIEDTIAVTAHGCEIITPTSKKLTII